MSKVLVKSGRYNGRYVAMKNVHDRRVVGSGKSPAKALSEARRNGVADPLLIFVPEKEMVNIY